MAMDMGRSSCGVGFVAALSEQGQKSVVKQALGALRRLEHRGGCASDQISGDGAGLLTEIPFELLGLTPGEHGVATLFLPRDARKRGSSLDIFEKTFSFMGLDISDYREVPVRDEVLGKVALSCKPVIRQAFIKRPQFCRTMMSFEKLLYGAKQMTRTKLDEAGLLGQFFFSSLSAHTIVYKALTVADDLARFYPDLEDERFRGSYAVFHRRYSTNTRPSWDKVQPFRMIGHNGEINTIAGNRSWSASREMSLGLPMGALLTREGISDSGSMNEMVEALKFRSSITRLDEIMGIMMPPAGKGSSYYQFWSRAMEPWDGPALVVYADGESVGARLDRNGFRPCRWSRTRDHFFLASEAGPFAVGEREVIERGSLTAGGGVSVRLGGAEVDFLDPSERAANQKVKFHPRLRKLKALPVACEPRFLTKRALFSFSKEDFDKILLPMITTGKEPIGSMGDTARNASLSDQPRSFFDFFYQNFAQVTNPPLDYLRESMVTDLNVYLGKRPNIFSPKELIPPVPCLQLERPVLSLAQMAAIMTMTEDLSADPKGCVLPMTFPRTEGTAGLRRRLETIAKEAAEAVDGGVSIIVLSDRDATREQPPVPSLLALRSVVCMLNNRGLRLQASIVVDSAEIRETHHLAALIGFGAAAVSPYLACEIARFENSPKLNRLSPDHKESNLLDAFTHGLLKIMAKMGISTVSGYQSSKLFTPVGLSKKLVGRYFAGLESPMGGLDLEALARAIMQRTEITEKKPLQTYLYKEHNKGLEGEKHAMTNRASKIIHQLVRNAQGTQEERALFDRYLASIEENTPLHPRNLFALREADRVLPLEQVEARSEIFRRFGAGAMSFGAISAESQRDIIAAMKQLGARANSGEGGENPYYYIDGTEATIKQIASGRFGVTAEYLMGGEEIQIKIAQGAKPGEGGQLMGIKVNEDIARARHASPGVDLISPPPMHDIYSIEDLKELIYEIKQLKPEARISVKLCAGSGIGTIAVGVAKAGADVIHIAGGDGGTGAASLSSMKHAGLSWELGLVEVHKALWENNLRNHVTLRVDGGLHTGRDIVMAAVLGAEEYDFGKLLLVAQGCVMARICEKNTCPTGIATHDPKFKAKYKGEAAHISKTLTLLAEDVRQHLARLGAHSLEAIIGRGDLLYLHPAHEELVLRKGLDMGIFLETPRPLGTKGHGLYPVTVSDLNQRIIDDCWPAEQRHQEHHLTYAIGNVDRGVLATLAGHMAREKRAYRSREAGSRVVSFRSNLPYGRKHFTFHGSAGQGFGAFLVEGIEATLWGEANDSVCKSMSGGKMVIRPGQGARFDIHEQTIIGNVALYGATGGTLFVLGRAGDRFAVRNSGAVAVADGAGLHACEYMTGGTVLLLGKVGANIGAGMTGGRLFLLDETAEVNENYVVASEVTEEDQLYLKELLLEYHEATEGTRVEELLEQWQQHKTRFKKYLPIKMAQAMATPRLVAHRA